MNALYHLAKADFLERVRRYSFLVTLAFAVYVGVAAARGQISLRLGAYVGVPNSAWVGGLMALTTTVFVSLAGFFIVSNAIHRDELTRVGQILAATPMSRFAYTLAKAVSNFAVLSAMVAILAVAGVAIVLFGHSAPLEFWPLLAPFLFLALPGMAMVAAVAVFFEATPVLRRVSAFAYLFLWVFTLANATGSAGFDPIGIHVISGSMMAALRAIDPAYQHTISFGVIAGGVGGPGVRKDFLWSGIAWTPALMVQHLLLFPLAAAIALLPALWFHRFDPARQWLKGKVKLARGNSDAATTGEPQGLMRMEQVRAAGLTVARRQSVAAATYMSLVACEIRLLAARRKWWVYAIAAGLGVAGFAVPLDAARHGLVAAIWILPMLYWSRVGSREDHFATRALIFSAPQAALRPLLASWIAGACLPLVLASGVVVRLLLARDFASAAALVVGAFFVVALALAIGNLARTPKAFEGVYVVWWYLGLMQGVPGIDFAGVTVASARPGMYAALTVGLMVAAWGVRELRSLRG